MSKTLAVPSTCQGRSRKRRAISREGMAMFLVLAVLLSSTATATMGLRTSIMGQRVTAFSVQYAQARRIAEAALVSSMAYVDSVGPAAVLQAMRELQALCLADTSKCPKLLPFEPDPPQDRHNYRIYDTDFANAPVTRLALGGYRQPSKPQFIVDINDDFIENIPVAGERADGQGSMRFLHATWTARGRVVTVGSDHMSTGDVRGYHERAYDVRAEGRSGPFSM